MRLCLQFFIIYGEELQTMSSFNVIASRPAAVLIGRDPVPQ
jgi:hypothetical protein